MHLIERKPVKNMGEVKATQAETNKKNIVSEQKNRKFEAEFFERIRNLEVEISIWLTVYSRQLTHPNLCTYVHHKWQLHRQVDFPYFTYLQ